VSSVLASVLSETRVVPDVTSRAADRPAVQLSVLLTRCRQEPALLVGAATLLLLSLDFLLAPALRNTSFLIATALFFCLVIRRLSVHCIDETPTPLSPHRLTIFCFLHLLLIALFNWAGSRVALYDASHRGLPLAAAKMLVFLPTALLVTKQIRHSLLQQFRPELFASGLALLTYFPFRIFVAAWPVYSKLLAQTVHFLAAIFVTGLGYVPGASPTITGPTLDVHILFGCSGLDGLRLFQLLFSLLLVCDWDRLRRWRTLTGYAAGLAAMLLANAMRIAAMVVIGNRISADLVVRYHLQAGWIYVTTVFLLLLLVSYRWLLAIDAADQVPTSTLLETQAR
jgi:exosortase/archaeosortase family protein